MSEPKDTLDARTASIPAGAAVLPAGGRCVVNGPEDQNLEWGAVDWRADEDEVRRLRQRIFTASKDGDHKPGFRSSWADVMPNLGSDLE